MYAATYPSAVDIGTNAEGPLVPPVEGRSLVAIDPADLGIKSKNSFTFVPGREYGPNPTCTDFTVASTSTDFLSQKDEGGTQLATAVERVETHLAKGVTLSVEKRRLEQERSDGQIPDPAIVNALDRKIAQYEIDLRLRRAKVELLARTQADKYKKIVSNWGKSVDQVSRSCIADGTKLDGARRGVEYFVFASGPMVIPETRQRRSVRSDVQAFHRELEERVSRLRQTEDRLFSQFVSGMKEGRDTAYVSAALRAHRKEALRTRVLYWRTSFRLASLQPTSSFVVPDVESQGQWLDSESTGFSTPLRVGHLVSLELRKDDASRGTIKAFSSLQCRKKGEKLDEALTKLLGRKTPVTLFSSLASQVSFDSTR